MAGPVLQVQRSPSASALEERKKIDEALDSWDPSDVKSHR
jgi:hypothetical protein